MPNARIAARLFRTAVLGFDPAGGANAVCIRAPNRASPDGKAGPPGHKLTETDLCLEA